MLKIKRFYIRESKKPNKLLKKNVSLEEGIDLVESSKEDITLMYLLPSNKGIKVATSKSNNEYSLAMEGYPNKSTVKIISTNNILKNLYLEIKNLKRKKNIKIL